MKIKLPLIILIFTSAIYAQKRVTTNDSIQKLDQVLISTKVIFGNKYEAKNRTGSSFYISPEELAKFNYTDITRILRTVPGVNVYEEDGFGLRPNISLRGTSPERSAKISVMEDGVLIAPAPYSAPAAYYFPSVARMQAVEILKGSSQIQYGPFTTGGAINLVSTQIPNSFKGGIKASYGSFNTGQIHAKVGDSKSNFGYALEFLNFNSDGFKNLPDGSNTGFDKNDVVAKFRLNSNAEAQTKQQLNFKFQYSDEVSNETYLGLSQNDFQNSPFSRYSSSQDDKMTNDHIQFMVSHELEFSEQFRITTDAYYNGFSRNWYKLNDVIFNGEKVGISSIVDSPESYPNHFDIVKGSVNSDDDAIILKANNRRYISKGIQMKIDQHWVTKNVFHDLEIGLRYHYDEEDRFQWVDGYNILNGEMNLTTAGTPGNDANRISSANAFAGSVLYKFKYDQLTLTPGIRYENISLEREDFGKNDVSRRGSDLSTRENNVDIFIPGIGFNFNFSPLASIYGGVHKGFSPPGSSPDQKAEESINYELGTRFNYKGLRGDAVLFYNDYSNLLGSDLAASGGTGTLDQFNAGEVAVRGLELLLNYEFLSTNSHFNLPVTFGYTYTDTEFLSSFGSDEDLWGEVNMGDEIPYIAKHQFNTSISLEHKVFVLNLNGRYNGAFRTLAGTGDITSENGVLSNFIIDFSGKYHLTENLSITGNIINLLDETYAASRVPAGLRPGHPFGAYGGLEFNF
ncbi:TonB-dependent receptor family protein [Seonamhaeicola aphaedonensis]|uniref:Fe(3+) dicitrate transport protein n=1 Tax=Seonamhaeicola aphaedonensis TaxID=1461338 RepID=A0A3D9HFQ1_9FLAO|nr:TonB-dependent receptor [Seonamhaeicola aphaedonensis]RED48319.1 Fe(3+) dicitrate transport protein [Seonamhaeicola aphaedonensis]